MPPGLSRRSAGDATGDAVGHLETPTTIELPPGLDAPPPIPPSLSASLVGPTRIASTSPAVVASEIGDLLPQSADETEPPTIAAPPFPPKQLLPAAAAATETITAAAPTLNPDRRVAKERDRRRFVGNLIVWGACTLLLCLVLWLLVFSSR